MQWLLDNWFIVLLGGGMIAMHLFGHGGHGGGHKGGKHTQDQAGTGDDKPVPHDHDNTDAVRDGTTQNAKSTDKPKS